MLVVRLLSRANCAEPTCVISEEVEFFKTPFDSIASLEFTENLIMLLANLIQFQKVLADKVVDLGRRK